MLCRKRGKLAAVVGKEWRAQYDRAFRLCFYHRIKCTWKILHILHLRKLELHARGEGSALQRFKLVDGTSLIRENGYA